MFDGNNTSQMQNFQLIAFNWDEVEPPYIVAAWLLLASIAKILFHVNKRVAETVPDSALMIVLGLAVGAILRLCRVDHRIYMLQSHTFFHYLLPPIIFDAGFFMPNRQLFENMDSILLFAFVGTIWNTLTIGYSLFWLGQFNLFTTPFTQFQILLFASLISAVDPVAVIAVFEEIHINEFLFINVFGEALFNDGVSVVLYQMFRKFAHIGPTNLDAMDYIEGFLSFLVISCGGVLIGLSFSAIACLATKFAQNVKILAPVFIFVVPYIAYLSAEMLGMSSILAIVTCGIAMKQYVKGNLSHDAYNSVKYFIKMLAQSSETVIFMFLGLSTVSGNLVWDWTFLGCTIFFCLLYRVIGVVVQCSILNSMFGKHFSLTDQFVLSYGGLRGAIAFGLAISTHANQDKFPARQMFITTTLAVIFFTVFVQGMTIRPLLIWLKVKMKNIKVSSCENMDQDLISEKIFERLMDFTMAGLEEINGVRGRNSLRDTFERFNSKVIKPLLMRGQDRRPFDVSTIIHAYRKITLQEALRITQTGTKITKHKNRIEKGRSQSSLPNTIPRSVSNVSSQTNWAPRRRDELDKFLSNRESVEFLYALFSNLLDRKIEELRTTREEMGIDDDIKDDYMGIIGSVNGEEESSEHNLTSQNAIGERQSILPNEFRLTMSRIGADQMTGANLLNNRRLSYPSYLSSPAFGKRSNVVKLDGLAQKGKGISEKTSKNGPVDIP